MTHFLKLFLVIERIKISKVFNGIIYGFRKIPLIGKYLGDKYYFYELKEIINTLIPIFSIIWQIIKSVLSFALVVVIARICIGTLYKMIEGNNLLFSPDFKVNIASIILTCVPFVTYISSSIYSTSIMDNSINISNLSKNFNFYPKDLAVIYTYFDPFLNFIGRSIGFVTIGYFFAKINPIYTFIFSLALFFYDINKSAFWTKIFDIRKDKIIKSGCLKFIFMLGFIFATLIITLMIRLDIRVLSLGFFAINIAGLTFSLKFLKSFNGYDKIIEKSIDSYKDALEESKKTQEEAVKIKSKDVEINKKVKGEGFVYLNNLFFIRHKRMLAKPSLIATGIFALVGITIFFILTRLSLKSNEIYEGFIYIIPIVSYILFKQEKILILFYKNCDCSLLYYGFYRENKNLLKMFWLRFRSIFKIMLVPMLTIIGIYGLFAYYFIEKDLISLLLPIIYIALNAIFFTILPLFQYYLFQPFDKEGNMRSWVVVVINIAIYYIFIFALPKLISYLGEFMFMMVISLAILLFAFIASLLIYKFSPKRFKIKS